MRLADNFADVCLDFDSDVDVQSAELAEIY